MDGWNQRRSNTCAYSISLFLMDSTGKGKAGGTSSSSFRYLDRYAMYLPLPLTPRRGEKSGYVSQAAKKQPRPPRKGGM